MAKIIATNTDTSNSDGYLFNADGDELYVPRDVHVVATGAGYFGVGGPVGAMVENHGRIQGADAGVSLGNNGQTSAIQNGTEGTINSPAGPAVRVDGPGYIVNFGLVNSVGPAIVHTGSSASVNNFSLINGLTGVIVGSGGVGYRGNGSAIVEQIDNRGLINGDVVLGDADGAAMINQATGALAGSALGSGGAVTFGDGDNDKFFNVGTMGALTMGDGDQAYVLNFGTMGGITLGDGDGDTIINDGRINGNVQLGNGTGQIFDSTLGTIGSGGVVTAGSSGATIVGALNGGGLVGGIGNDVLTANQTTLVGYAVLTTLDGKGGTNALYGGQGTNLFLSGDATFNQIWGGEAVSSGGYANNTVDYSAVTGAGRSIYVDLLDGHNAYIIDQGTYTLIDSIANVPNVNGTEGVDVIRSGHGLGVITGLGGGDQLYTGTGATTFLYTGFGDSNLISGYDTISGFRAGVDKIDVSALGLSVGNALIQSNASNTVLYLEATPGTFNAATDVAISFAGANALSADDITFVSGEPDGWSFFDYSSYFGTGYPAPSFMPTGGALFSGRINVGLVLDRAHDPTALLESDWGARQKQLAALGDDVFSYYGATQDNYNALRTALHELHIEPSSNPAYESSAESRTIWVSLTADRFEELFGQTLYLQGEKDVYWNGNLALNPTVAALGTVKGLSFDTDYGHVGVAKMDLPEGVLPDGSSVQGVTLQDGRQGPGNDTSGGAKSLNPQDVAALYNFPLMGSEAATGAIGLIEPGMGDDLFTDTAIFDVLLDNYRLAIDLSGGVEVHGQPKAYVSSSTDTTERALDVGVATAINPNSKLVLYAGSGTDDNAGASAYTAFQSALFDPNHPDVISSSYRAGSMQPGADSPFLWAARELMKDLALKNISVFQSSGDGGSSYSGDSGLTNTANSRASAYSVIVGGTSLSTGQLAQNDPSLQGWQDLPDYVALAEKGDPEILWQLVAGGLVKKPSTDSPREDDWFIETVWNRYKLKDDDKLDPSYLGNESGNGGVDYTQATPWYQSALLPFAQPTTTDAAHVTGRGVPDVAALAAGNMNYSVPYPDLLPGADGPTRGDGGTSAASPLWASLAVQINTIFENQLLPKLGYMTDLLYIAAAVAPASFNDVSVGNDTSSFVMGGDYKALNPQTGETDHITPTGAGYSAAPGYDLASGLGSPNGVLLARALTAIAQSQMNYDSVPDVVTLHDGAWKSGALQTLLVQTMFPDASGTVSVVAGDHTLDFISQASDLYAWNSRFAGQVEQNTFDPELVKLFDHRQQGKLDQIAVETGDALSVSINGSQASGATGQLTSAFGFIDFQTADGNVVRLARPVAVAETVVDPTIDIAVSPVSTAIVRLRQADNDSLAVRFYQVDDYTGAIGGVRPGDANYAQSAAGRAYTLSSGGEPADPTWLEGRGHGLYGQGTFEVHGGDIIAMELKNISQDMTYWAFSQANESVDGQPVGHLWNYGLNTWGWEAGGDHDFNDLMVQLDFTSAYGQAFLA